jgi:hypothetical protein
MFGSESAYATLRNACTIKATRKAELDEMAASCGDLENTSQGIFSDVNSVVFVGGLEAPRTGVFLRTPD